MLFFLFVLMATIVAWIAGAVVSVLGGAFAGFSAGIAVFLLMVGSCILQGMRQLPADPLTIGIRTYLGTPRNKTVGSGWSFFFGYPYLDGYIEVNAAKVSQDIQLEMLTPDEASNKIPVSIEWEFDPTNPLPYLQSGKEEGVKEILANIVTEIIREWVNSKLKGPQNYDELREAGEEAINIILKAILGESEKLGKIPFEIPTPILLKYFHEPRKDPTKNEEVVWGKDWERVREALNALPEDEQRRIKDAIEHRRDQIQKARQGLGDFQKQELGIKILRLTLGNIEPSGEILKKLHERKIAEIGLDVETQTATNFREEVEQLVNVVKLPPTTANETALVRRGKITKKIEESKQTHDIGPELGKLLNAGVDALRLRFGGGGN